MKKVVIFLLGLVVLAFVAKKYLDAPSAPPPGETSEAKRRLDSVRDKAKQFERDDQRRADELLKGSEGK